MASSSLVALVAAQQKNNAAILSDARYLSNNGQFGAAYTQGDGVQFKEESDAEGNRRGSYSYVDPSGQRRTVSYTAGKDGFKATGDHLPVAPSPVPVPAAVPAAAPKSPWQDQWLVNDVTCRVAFPVGHRVLHYSLLCDYNGYRQNDTIIRTYVITV